MSMTNDVDKDISHPMRIRIRNKHYFYPVPEFFLRASHGNGPGEGGGGVDSMGLYVGGWQALYIYYLLCADRGHRDPCPLQPTSITTNNSIAGKGNGSYCTYIATYISYMAVLKLDQGGEP
jgi:hypothetical protein